MKNEDVGSWFNYYIKLKPLRSLGFAALITGFFYSLDMDYYQLELGAKIALWTIGIGFTYLAFWRDWKIVKKRQANRKG